jgi:hypothetical protein
MLDTDIIQSINFISLFYIEFLSLGTKILYTKKVPFFYFILNEINEIRSIEGKKPNSYLLPVDLFFFLRNCPREKLIKDGACIRNIKDELPP